LLYSVQFYGNIYQTIKHPALLWVKFEIKFSEPELIDTAHSQEVRTVSLRIAVIYPVPEYW